MNEFLNRAARLFVAPAVDTAPRFAPPQARPRPALTGVLATEHDLAVAGGAAAAALRRESRAATALVCLWRGTPDAPLAAPAPALPGAARLAAKLTRRGLGARGCGAICVVELPADPEEAAAAARDAIAATDAPAVLAVARRHPVLDLLLAEADRLVVALSHDADPLLADLAEVELSRLGTRVERAPVPSGFAARQAARAGFAAAAPAPPAVAAPHAADPARATATAARPS